MELADRLREFVELQQVIEKALDAYCKDHPSLDRLSYWQSFNVEEWEGANHKHPTLEVFWATPSYGGHPSENGTIRIAISELEPYM